MSHLSYMEKLLDGVDVEWLPLKEVLVRTKGTKITAGQMKVLHKDGAPLKIFAGGKTVAFVDFNDIPEKDVNREPSIIVKSRGVIEFEYYEKPFSHKSEMWSYYSDNDAIHIKFIYHFLKLHERHFQGIGSRMQMPQIATPDTDKFLVPIPCPDNPEKSLAIQAEIVRILDAFTAMTAELTAELNMRKKQYNYYRDQLLSFEQDEVEWKILEDVASFRRGSFPQPYGNSEWYDGESCMPFVQVADVADFGFTLHQTTKQKISKLAQPKSVFVEKGTVVVSLQGTIGRVAITQYDSYVDRTLAIFTSYKEDINKKYFAHQLKAKFDKEKEFARGSTLKTITKAEFSKFQIPIPSIEKQNRIVSILDKFDVLTHSIQEGLPREIELRQKQYEYYRDLLLSFPKSHPDEAA
ncbi:restriction endonuclease subunit S [Neptuniibacter sp.]|uniref:restriction endonuclease subunit S n=1 Tax=Neptuniibacter sp. TaxID=1962643 RepID=UPI0026105783|nr:restriction endonuclease subunit S [Neptuniibacter sp.]MCP4598699.1 restriction endonuclease subunit S [Neptuniibacter sp.]